MFKLNFYLLECFPCHAVQREYSRDLAHSTAAWVVHILYISLCVCVYRFVRDTSHTAMEYLDPEIIRMMIPIERAMMARGVCRSFRLAAREINPPTMILKRHERPFTTPLNTYDVYCSARNYARNKTSSVTAIDAINADPRVLDGLLCLLVQTDVESLFIRYDHLPDGTEDDINVKEIRKSLERNLDMALCRNTRLTHLRTTGVPFVILERTELEVYECNDCGDSFAYPRLPQGALTPREESIQEIRLQRNNLSELNVRDIVNLVSRCQQLTILDLTGNRLNSGKSVTRLNRVIQVIESPHMKWLIMDQNHLDGFGADLLASGVQSYNDLNNEADIEVDLRLSLNDNVISAEDQEELRQAYGEHMIDFGVQREDLNVDMET